MNATRTDSENLSPGPLPALPPSPGSPVAAWLRLARHPNVVRRALITAVIVGTVLVAINDGPAILSGNLSRRLIIQMCLTVLVPYIVSTVSSISTRRELGADRPALTRLQK